MRTSTSLSKERRINGKHVPMNNRRPGFRCLLYSLGRTRTIDSRHPVVGSLVAGGGGVKAANEDGKLVGLTRSV